MPSNNPLITIIRSAIQFAFYGLLGLFAVMSIVIPLVGGIIFFSSSRSFVVFYFLPTILLIGATWGLASLFTHRLGLKTKKRLPLAWTPSAIIGIILFFTLLIALVALPHFIFKEKDYVDHEAKWYYVDPSDDTLPWSDWQRSNGIKGRECDTELVLFVIQKEDSIETLFICDQAVVNYIDTLDDHHVRITYELTYNFGDFRWDLPFSLGSMDLENTGWRGGEGCGGVYNHPCDSQYAGISFLQESMQMDD